MTSSQLDAWRRRPLEVRVLDLCPECKQLKEGVKTRQSYWPTFSMSSCNDCYTERVAEFNSLTT